MKSYQLSLGLFTKFATFRFQTQCEGVHPLSLSNISSTYFRVIGICRDFVTFLNYIFVVYYIQRIERGTEKLSSTFSEKKMIFFQKRLQKAHKNHFSSNFNLLFSFRTFSEHLGEYE